MPSPHPDPFERALEDARRKGGAGGGEGSTRIERPYVRASAALGRAPAGGGEARWGLAMDWTGEPSEPEGALAPTASRPTCFCSDAAAEIASELGIDGELTLERLMSLWRDFVWRNHPDRQPAQARERANARVAIANALYDRARRELVNRR